MHENWYNLKKTINKVAVAWQFGIIEVLRPKLDNGSCTLHACRRERNVYDTKLCACACSQFTYWPVFISQSRNGRRAVRTCPDFVYWIDFFITVSCFAEVVERTAPCLRYSSFRPYLIILIDQSLSKRGREWTCTLPL